MGNSSDKKKAQDLVFLKTLTLNYERQKIEQKKKKKILIPLKIICWNMNIIERFYN